MGHLHTSKILHWQQGITTIIITINSTMRSSLSFLHSFPTSIHNTIMTTTCKATRSRYLTSTQALTLDKLLMSPRYGHTLPQLMELAGLSVAHSIASFHPPTNPPSKIVIACGPGNNGGDGLVAARHLHHFGYSVLVHYPKPNPREPFISLLTQLHALDIPLVDTIPTDAHVVVDAVFGFSFKGENGIRQPFQNVIQLINSCTGKIVAVDVPSGWHVEKGDIFETAVRNVHALISLTAPKLCAKMAEESGVVHYVAGRFVPHRLVKELNVELPKFEGDCDFVRVN